MNNRKSGIEILGMDIGHFNKVGKAYERFLAKSGSNFNLVKGKKKYAIKNEVGRNEIVIYDEIGFWGVDAESFRDDVSAMKGDIDVRLDTPGGDVFAGMAMYNTLKQYDRGKVNTYIDGEAASAGGIIFLAGDNRYAPETSFLMLHEAWGGVIGNKREIEQFRGLLQMLDDQILNIVLKFSTRPDDETKAEFEKELWMSGKSAKEWGFVSELIEYDDGDLPDDIPVFDLSVFNNVPDTLNQPEACETQKPKDWETALRDAGMSRREAKAVLSEGLKALSHEPEQPDTRGREFDRMKLEMDELFIDMKGKL
jgi:ATP-dependent Clp endopeptidase proteolytic subunit ClpP